MPSEDMLARRARALEYEFFYHREKELIRRLGEKAKTDAGRRRLGKITGIGDQAVLNELMDAGIQAETLVALTLAPLVQVAWADPIIDSDKCDEILKAAQAAGVGKETASYHLLSGWLQQKPEAKLFAAWKQYIAELKKTLEPAKLQQLKDDITRRAREVAKKTGILLGIARIPDAEAAVLKEVEQAFDD